MNGVRIEVGRFEDSEYLQSKFKEAMAYLDSGQPQSALNLIDNIDFSDTKIEGEIRKIEARAAHQLGQFGRAVSAWRLCQVLCVLDARHKLIFGQSLLNAGEVGEGYKVLSSLCSDIDVGYAASTQLSAFHHRLGNHSAALITWHAAFSRASTDDELFRARVGRAKAWHRIGNLEVALTEYHTLSHLRPNHQAPICGTIGILIELRHFEEAERQLSQALTRFPSSMELLKLKAQMLNRSAEEAGLIEFVEELMVLPKLNEQQRGALIEVVLGSGRGQFFLESSRDAIRKACGIRIPSLLLDGLLENRAAEVKLEATEARLASQIQGSLSWVQAVADKAVALIEMNRAEDAEVQVDILRTTVANWPYLPTKYARLTEWLNVRRGAVRAAQQSWRARRILVNSRDRTAELALVRSLPGTPPPVTVICQLRNERALIEPFLAHYRRGGIERFTFIDNGSDDGTLEFLEAQDDVELYSTQESFRRARAGNDWVNPLIARPEYASSLCLRVDADEHMVFPGYEERSFGTLWRFMQSEGAEAIHGFMLDVFPEYLSMLDAEDGGLAACRYFDRSDIKRPMPDCPYIRYYGGTRARLLGKFQSLGKVSGIRGGGAIEYIAASHSCSPAKVSSVSYALLHHKFYPGFLQKIERIIQEKQHAMASQEYAHYTAFADRLDERLPGPDSLIFEGSKTLIEANLCNSPAAWQDFH